MPIVFTVRKKLVHKLVEGEAALLQYAGFAILSEDDVVEGQGGGGADGYAFFAC